MPLSRDLHWSVCSPSVLIYHSNIMHEWRTVTVVMAIHNLWEWHWEQSEKWVRSTDWWFLRVHICRTWGFSDNLRSVNKETPQIRYWIYSLLNDIGCTKGTCQFNLMVASIKQYCSLEKNILCKLCYFVLCKLFSSSSIQNNIERLLNWPTKSLLRTPYVRRTNRKTFPFNGW